MKKSASLVLAFSIACSAFAGSAAAATQLETAVDKLIGVDYKYGGSTVKGFDCSGFTSYVFDKFGISLPRRSADQAKEGIKVAKDELRPGDLVFFNTSGSGISHVGIYMGDGKFAHASTNKGVTIGKMDDKYYKPRYVTARRVLGGDLYLRVATEKSNVTVASVSDTEPTAPEVAAAAENEPTIDTDVAVERLRQAMYAQ